MIRRFIAFAVVVAAVCVSCPVPLLANHANLRAGPGSGPPASVGFAATPSGDGYWVLHDEGQVASFGAGRHVQPGLPHLTSLAAGVAGTPTGRGYWIAAGDGGVFAYGDARFLGSAADLPLRAPVVDIVATSSGAGYWLLAADGGVFTYGDARFLGAAPEWCDACSRPHGVSRVFHPAVALAATPAGDGYWVAYRNGTVRSFGAATSDGSATSDAAAVVDVAATPSGRGLWVVTADGVVTARGDARHHGDARELPLQRPVHSIGVTRSGGGYWLAAGDGGVFAFGDATFHGSDVEPQPPGATASAGAGELRMSHGSSCWHERERGICADMLAPGEETPRLVAPAGGEVAVRFLTTHTPTHVAARISVNDIDTARHVPMAATNPSRFTAPTARGLYFVIVETLWDHVEHGHRVSGDASYYVRLEVR